jgi:hypothetical protein
MDTVAMIDRQEEIVKVSERCPMPVPGGVQCHRPATVVPQAWEMPPYGVPGKAVCAGCYQEMRSRALGAFEARRN